MQKQKDMAKGEKKAKEVPAHQASCRGLRSASGLGRCGLTTAVTGTCPGPVRARRERARGRQAGKKDQLDLS